MPLAGVEFGTECYCGKAIKAGAAKAAASDCNMDCSGKSASPETCGGNYRSVSKTGRGRRSVFIGERSE
jgi:hypothetical protein